MGSFLSCALVDPPRRLGALSCVDEISVTLSVSEMFRSFSMMLSSGVGDGIGNVMAVLPFQEPTRRRTVESRAPAA